MPALDSKLRSQLDDVCQKARDVAEAAARSALQKRAVDAAEPHKHFSAAEKELRNRLRARGRQAGDVRKSDKTQSIDCLGDELAYEYWHRMLFARFLAENGLLMHPDGVAVSLEECEELAPEADPPAANGFVLAARYASTMLPQIFRTDDVLLEVEFAPEQRLALERLLASLPQETFLTDDSLGWVYQFWQTAEKKRVNDSGDKIDGRTLPAVTQLFTEHYMVEFLLHNTIGAWWCGRHGIKGPPGGAGIPAGLAPVEMPYLRWRDDGTPAAGTFDGWPKSLTEFTMLDPCCGSGHFLVAAFNLLVPLRMHDEGLTAAAACESVLRENLHGLELDPRCTQIAAFALALAAWKYPGADGYRLLPPLNIACSGQGVTGKKEEWLALANGNDRLREGMDRLYDLFQQAPHLGSLIDPRREKGNMYEAGYVELQPHLTKALAKKPSDADFAAVGVAAQGVTRAAGLLAKGYTLVVTNVPYLGRGKQVDGVKDYLEEHYFEGKADLATAFVMRCLDLCKSGGSTAVVTPQNWLFQTTYKKLREGLLRDRTWNIVARLGSNAFRDMNWWAAKTALVAISAAKSACKWEMACTDVSADKDQVAKAARLSNDIPTPLHIVRQADQLDNPDAVVALEALGQESLLKEAARCLQGIGTADINRYIQTFWEQREIGGDWSRYQMSPEVTADVSGCHSILRWESGEGTLSASPRARICGQPAWDLQGFVIGVNNTLPRSRYFGGLFDCTAAVLIPNDQRDLLAVSAFVHDASFYEEVRKVDEGLSVTESSFVKVPFDLGYWQSVAAEKYPNGLPEPSSADPTQWLFKGDIATSTNALQVAAARLLGYRWPEQPKTSDAIDNLADGDGIVCLPGVRGEPAAAEGLLDVLHAAYGKNWSDSVLHQLLTDAGCKAGTTLDDWLRGQFFEQHCKLFHNRPFIWHIWDGRKDGFSVLVNYHKLTHKGLENLTYSYLGDWIKAQAAEAKAGKAGADLRLGAAQELQDKLKLILSGEPPYDIFVRWKPLHEQAIGWHPDLNDGVRQNIRPFIKAGILRKEPKSLLKDKDRGKEPQRDQEDFPWFWDGKTFTGDRVNNVHLTNEEKQAARRRKKT